MAQLVKSAFNTTLRQSIKILNTAEVQVVSRRHLVVTPASSSAQAKPLPDYRLETEPETKWLFPLYREMELMAVGHKYGALMTGARFRYNTVKPLKIEHVEQALYHLQRKLPNFRCYIKRRGDHLWACEHTDPEIDFEVLEGVRAEDVVNHFSNTPVHYENAPLWKTRLISVPDDSPCVLPEIKAAFPYQYDFVFALHHSFIDGSSMAFATQKLVELLNDVIAGRSIDDSKPFGELVSDRDIHEVDVKVIKQLEADPVKVKAMKEELMACDTSPIILKAFPPPGGARTTKHLSRDIKPKSLQGFTANCKKAGVTFNSGFEALINTALVEMVRDAGVDENSHQISINLATDLRRYMKRYDCPIVGLLVRPIVHRVETHQNVRENFWEYTQMLHSKLSHLVKSGEAMHQYAVRLLTMPQISPEDLYRFNPPVIRDYGLTNIGDLTKILPGEGEHLQQTDVITYTSVQKAMFMMLHQIYTFRGHTPYSISYDTSYMSDDTANLLMERIMHLLNNFSQ